MIHISISSDELNRALVLIGVIVSLWSLASVYFLVKFVEHRENRTMNDVLRSAASAIRARRRERRA